MHGAECLPSFGVPGLKWPVRLVLLSVVFFALGVVALWLGKFSLSSLETSASFIATGTLVFLVWLLLRKVSRSFD